MSKNSDDTSTFGVGILLGVLAGAIAGVLLSPKPGEEMRDDLQKVADKLSQKEPIEVSRTKKITSDTIVKMQYILETQFTRVLDAVKAGKMVTAKRREELDSDYRY